MTCTFVLTRVTPGGPEAVLMEHPNLRQEQLDRLRAQFGLNDSIPVAYVKWISSAVRFDFGRSYRYVRPPLEVMMDRLGPTVQLEACALVIGLLGIPLGIWAAMRRGEP